MTTADGRVRRALAGDRSLMVTRAIPLLDIEIRPRSKGGDGRTVDAYAAVFNIPSEIVDQDGHYDEQNDPGAFNRSLTERSRQIFCVYNHAKTLQGTPSDLWSVPIGVPVDGTPRADPKGLLTSTRYNNDPDSERILEAIKSGSLTGMSYTGVFLRSTPELKKFERYQPLADGSLPLVTRLEIALIEYGPTPIPAFDSAVVLGVRSGNREIIRMATSKKHPPESADDTSIDVRAGKGTMSHDEPDADDTIDSGPGASNPANDDDADDNDTIGTGPADKKGKKGRGGKKAVGTEADDTGDTSGNYDDVDENGKKRAGSGTAKPTWDGPAAMSKAANSSDPASALSSICAGKRAGDPATEAAHALPHHDSPGGPPNPTGVAAALGRLDSTEGLTNKEEARKHLLAHQSGEKGQKGDTSSSGRNPAAEDASSRTEPGDGTGTADEHGPRTHPAGNSREDTTMSGDRMTVAERAARQAEIRARFTEIDEAYSGAELPQDVRTEWEDLSKELVAHDRAIADATARAKYLAEIAEAGGDQEGVSNENAGYLPPAYGGGGRDSGRAAEDYRTATGRNGKGGRYGGQAPAFHRDNSYIWDLSTIRNRARSIDEVPEIMRDYAMRAIDSVRYPGTDDVERAQANIERMLNTIDDEKGSLAKRILVTGSPTYDRAFGKACSNLALHGLSQEESRALALGTDSAGGFAVPFQLDPTILLTSNGAINPLRQIARVEQITGKEWDGVTSAGVTVSRAAEAAENSDGSPTLAQPAVRTTRVQGFIPFNIELDVSWGALRSQMTALLMDAKDVEEATSFTLGNGTAPNCNGIITTLSTASAINTATTATLAIADLYALENAMAPRFRQQSAYLASKTIYNKMRVLFQAQASSAGDSWVRPSAGTPASFNGYDAYESSVMAGTTTSASKVLLQGDFKQFLIVDRVGLGIELVPHLFGASNRFPTGQRGILAMWFNNSKVLVDNAFRLLTVL